MKEATVNIDNQNIPSLYMGGAFAFLFNSLGEILILREDSKHRKYDWDMPGGTLKQEESPVDGLHREILEETGLTITVLHPACLLKWDRHESGHPILVAFYIAARSSSTLTLSPEHVQYRWISKDTIAAEKISLPPGPTIVNAAFNLYESVKSNE